MPQLDFLTYFGLVFFIFFFFLFLYHLETRYLNPRLIESSKLVSKYQSLLDALILHRWRTFAKLMNYYRLNHFKIFLYFFLFIVLFQLNFLVWLFLLISSIVNVFDIYLLMPWNGLSHGIVSVYATYDGYRNILQDLI